MTPAVSRKISALQVELHATELDLKSAQAAFEAACVRGESGPQKVEGERALRAVQDWLDTKAAVWALVRAQG